MGNVLHFRAGGGNEPSFPRAESLSRAGNRIVAELKADHLASMGRLQGRAVDPLSFYARFPERWAAFLNDSFRGYPEGEAREVAVAVFYSVTQRCARKWLNGLGGCNGDKLAYSLQRLSEAAPHKLVPALQMLFAAE